MKRIESEDGLITGYFYRGFRVLNHGYYHPDKCVWWEAVDLKTGCADFHAHTKKEIKKLIDKSLDNTLTPTIEL